MAHLQIVPAIKNVEAQYVEMKVPLYSYGCEKKIKKALAHLKGIYSVNVDYNQQKVTVWGICNKYDVLASVKNKRKETRFWYPEESIEPELEEYESQPSPPPTTTLRSNGSVPHWALSKGRSLSWKAWKKVFTRSYSF